MDKLCRCKHTLWILRHKIIKVKGKGYRCKYCGRTFLDLHEEAKSKERERRSRTWE